MTFAEVCRRLVLPTCVVAFQLLFSGAIMSPSTAADTPEPIIRVLPNGMTIILRENHSAPVVSIQAWVKTGSAREGSGEEGMAHLLEHMFFKGTKSRGVGAIAAEVEAAGGEINAYTSWDTTVYLVNMASRFMDRGIDILADILQSATFDPQEMAKEKLVVLEEIRRSKDMPSRRLSERFFSEAYITHPYRRPVIGFEENVREFTRDMLVDFCHKWYVPGNMVWVMAGDIDPDKVLPSLEARLSKLPARSAPTAIEVKEPPQDSPKIFVMREESQQAHLEIGFHIPGVADPDVPALDLLAQIVGQGESSRLYRSLRMRRRLVNSIHAYSLTPRDPGLFLVDASLETGDVRVALNKILREIFRCGFQPIEAEEMDTAKVQVESDFIFQQETVQGQARELGYYEATTGSLDFGRLYLEGIRAAGTTDIRNVARTYLRPENMTIGVLLPQSTEEPLDVKGILKDVQKYYARLESRQARKDSAGAKGEGISSFRLENGATLLVKRNPGVPIVSLNAVLLGGLLSENRETNGISHFTAAMLTKGTPSRDAERIAREIEALAGNISGFSGKNSLGLTSEVVSWNFPAAFEIFSDILLHPEFPEEYVDKTRRDILAAIKNQEDDLANTSFKLFWKTLFPCHPYGMDMLGTPETIQGIDRADLQAYYAREAVAPNLVLSVVGDVDVQETRKMVEKALASMPSTRFELPSIRCEAKPEHHVERIVSPDKLQAHIILGARGASFKGNDKYSLDVLQAVLSGQGGRLFVELRDRQGLAYVVTAFNSDAYDPGAFGIYMATRPDNWPTAVREMREQVDRVRDEKLPREELERAKNFLIGSHDLSIQTNSSQASLTSLYERYGLGYDTYLAYARHIQDVTAGQVRESARKYLCPECLVEVVVMPEGNAEGAAGGKGIGTNP